jgi:adenylate kinase family enzyme
MKTKQLILLGPPGLAVTQQAADLAQRWQVPHVSLGELVQTVGDADVRAAIETGDPAADPPLLKLIRRRFEQPDVMLKGWVLDGFPHTLTQAQAFEDWWAKFGKPPATVVYLKAMTGLLMNRLAEESGQPAPTIRRRLERHQTDITPVLDYYQQRSQLQTLNASRSFAEVAAALAELDQTDTGAARLIANEAELDQLLATTPYLVVDCMASWCGSCKQIAPYLDRLAETYSDRATVVKIDFDVNRQITKRFGLQGIPAVMFFQQGELRETLTGVKAYPEYEGAIERLISSEKRG